MHRPQKVVLLITVLVALFSWDSRGQEEAGWRISPEKINIQAGTSRTLQVLDERAQELRGALWSIDLRIWPADLPIPEGATTWGMRPIGQELGDVAAAPGVGSTNTFSLDQSADGSTYLRAVSDEGIQEWAWLMPEKAREAELICGDWLGGALVAANRGDSFTLYLVGNDGQLRWHRRFAGTRRAHAYNLAHLLHMVTQSGDGGAAMVTGLEGLTGEQRFELPIPASHEHLNHVRRRESNFVCASEDANSPALATVSGLFVNIDGFAYVAFAHNDWAVSTGACAAGAVVNPRNIALSGEQRLILWQIHPDGTRRETVIEEIRSGPSSGLVASLAPTREIIPDGLGGVLLSVRRSPDAREATPRRPEEFLYRLDGDGRLVYKLPLPAYDGRLKDSMVLGGHDRGFTTRGSLLIAFDVRDGRELWRWEAGVRGIEVFAALADGGCLVQTPDALVNVRDATNAREVFEGKAILGWNGQLYRKRQ